MSEVKNSEFVNYIQSYFKESYQCARPHLEMKEEIQRAFDGLIDPDTWATLSEINIPLLRTAVLQAVPFIVNYLFPSSKFIELIPSDENVPYEAIKRIEQILENQLIGKMKVKRKCIPIIQDAVKFGCGYGEVRKKLDMQPARQLVQFFGEDGSVSDQQSRMTASVPTENIDVRWIPFECIIPTPDGDSPDDVSCVFHVDSMREDELRRMFIEDQSRNEEDRILTGSAEEIIEDTRSGLMDGGAFPLWWIMANLGGDNNEIARLKRYDQIRKLTAEYGEHKAPVVIPILKCYFKGEHIWLANGKEIIYHVKGGLDTLACPIIKASSAIDGGNWYAQSDVMASKDVSDGIITFKNALMDLMTNYLHPTAVYDERAMAQAGKAPDIEPYSKISVHGKVGEAISYLQPPQINPAVLSVGQALEQDNSASNGQPLQLGGQGTAGLMRGGGGAFESLMQGAQTRTEFLGVLMEMGLIEPIVQQTLLMMQMSSKESFSFMSKKDKEYVKVSITQDEIRNAFDIRVNLAAKLRSGINSESMAIARYVQAYRGNIYVDQQAALETINPDTEEAARLTATPEQIQRNIEQQQAQQQAAQQSMGGTQGEQAVMGGASQRSGSDG